MPDDETDGVSQAQIQALGTQPKTREELVVDLLKSYRTYVFLSIFGYLIGAYVLSVFPRVGIPRLAWFVGGLAVVGYLIGGTSVMYRVKPYLTDKRVTVGLATVDGDVYDTVKIPRETFTEFTVLGEKFPERKSVLGSTVLVARYIDFENRIIVPAGDFPRDEDVPDDVDLIGDDGDAKKVEEYRQSLLYYAKQGRDATTDRIVLKEEAVQDVVNEFAVMFEEMRDSESEELSVENLEKEMDTIIREMSVANQQSVTGDEDE